MNGRAARNVLAMLSAFLLLVSACERATDTPDTVDAQSHALLHAQPEYACPMHPEFFDDEPGNCPICGMDLVERNPAADAPEILYFRHPHNPTITSDVPRTDEMGMDYVAVYREDSRTVAGVRISPSVRHNLGVRTAGVRLAPLPRRIKAVGRVIYDEARLQHVHARAEGWVHRVHVASVGDRVSRGQVLVELFSPELVAAQEEFLQALRMGGETLIGASEARLRALGISAADVAALRRVRKVDGTISFRSDMDGVVTRLAVREGMFVRPDDDMIVMADLSKVWIEADVLTRQSGWLRPGLPAAVSLDQSPGPALDGEVAYVYPEADPITRAIRVRLAFDNPGERLKPNSFATVSIAEIHTSPVLQIPREALIRTSRHTRVIVEEAPQRFVPRLIQVAYEEGEAVAVAAGLGAGEQVVTSGQFMLDSEAALRGELERLTEPDPAHQPASDDPRR